MRKALTVFTAIVLGLVWASASAQEAQAPPPPTVELSVKREAYTYTSSNRRDPFLSIIDAASRAKKAKTKEKKEKGLTPLEDYDISQINLIAIVWDKANSYAMIGLPDRKYYTIRAGMNIGIHGGKVQRITEDAVVVREYLPDYKGQLRADDTFIRLRTEEGE